MSKDLAKSPRPKAKVVRRLGPMERYQAALHHISFYCSTIVTCRYTLPPSLTDIKLHNQAVSAFERAIAQTVIQYPLLQVGLAGGDSKKPSWIHLESIDLARHIEWQIVLPHEDYDAVFRANMRRQLDTKYEHLETQPGWRLLALRSEEDGFVEVMFAWHHSHCDGMGGKMFHETLLKCLNNPVDVDAPDTKIIQTRVVAEKFPPPENKVVEWPITADFILSYLWKSMKPSVLVPKISPEARWAPVRPSPYETAYTSIKVDNGTLKSVLKACKTHSTTLTGLLHAITLVSLSAQLSEEEAPAVSCRTAINARRFSKPPPDCPWPNPEESVMNCVTVLDHIFGARLVNRIRGLEKAGTVNAPELEEALWAAAQMIRHEIEERLDAGLTNNHVGMMKFVGDWQHHHKAQGRRPRELSWLVTNIGVIDGHPTQDAGAEADTWAIDRSSFTLSADVTGPFIQISAVSAKGGCLSIDISWQDYVVDKNVGGKLASDMEAWFKALGS
ncbi:hypothetical protein ACJZ2D_009165 [Fusarium nematophilum]